MENIPNKTIRKNILWVDNDSIITTEAQKLIEPDSQLNIVTAKNAKEALIKLAQQKPVLVILEIILPIISGYILINEIKKQYPNIPMLIYTKLKKQEDLEKIGALKIINIYLKELISINSLIETIKQGNEKSENIKKTVNELNEKVADMVNTKNGYTRIVTQCPNCNVAVPPDASFCNNCGQKVERKSKEKLTQTPKNKEGTTDQTSEKTPSIEKSNENR